jgi:type I restriction enzyme M protein
MGWGAIMTRKDKTDRSIFRHLENCKYSGHWEDYSKNDYINGVLSHASKTQSGNEGYPDGVYTNETKKLLILLEVKPDPSKHVSKDGGSEPEKYAVDGIKHYLKFFLKENLKNSTYRDYFKPWKFIGLAISGDLNDEYNHRISTFTIINQVVIDQNISGLLDEEDYQNLFETINEEEIIKNISISSKKINKILRNVDSQKRPVLLSALMICLFEKEGIVNDFRNNYANFNPTTISTNIPPTVKHILSLEEVPQDKIDILLNELTPLWRDIDLTQTDILKNILNELRDNVIPLFKRKSNYDIIGKFYEEFLRYAGVANVKRGIVLTPRHITGLFTDLVPIKTDDVFFDPACGTGAFLIAGMNKLIDIIEASALPDKKTLIKNIKTTKLIGFEKNPTMYSLAISNMLFRGDGKSQIYYCDCFTPDSDKELIELSNKGIIPTIGFVNPPYGGKDNKDNPTKKEIQFLTRMLDTVSRYGVIIAPLSMYFKEDSVRNAILKKHTLTCVINMPGDLFQPNAATNTAIAVFETNKPHGNQEVVFYNLKDDGLVLSKSRGRTDVYNKWNRIKTNMLTSINNPIVNQDGITLVKTKIKDDDEWLIQAHAKTDYSKLSENNFARIIKEYLIFNAKKEMDLLEKDIDEITILEILNKYYSTINWSIMESTPNVPKLYSNEWKLFRMDEIFDLHKGKRLIKEDMSVGATNFIGAISKNNGIRQRIDEDPLYIGNCITVNYNGSVGEAYYQKEPFWASDDVNVLFLKKEHAELNIYIAFFLITIIERNKNLFDFGRKWNLEKMKATLIGLPINNNKPDWIFMEKYIRSLPYSSYL